MKNEIESKEMLRNFGISTTNPQLATNATEAAAISAKLGKPVVMKIVSRDILHKVAAGGVLLGVTPEGASAAFTAIMNACKASTPDAILDGILIEELVPKGYEVFIGARIDKEYGGVVLLGKGGTNVEQMAPPIAALVPLDEELARRRAAQDIKGWKPVNPRPRKISAALKAYAMLATSADMGAVRDLSKLEY